MKRRLSVLVVLATAVSLSAGAANAAGPSVQKKGVCVGTGSDNSGSYEICVYPESLQP